MSKYMIHACIQRLDYVNNYLIPSMLSQGIKRSDIFLACDYDCIGCLQSYLLSFEQLDNYLYSLPNKIEGVWHLQDDIILSRDFKTITELYDEGVVCGFCSQFDDDNCIPGYVNPSDMWYSFPCIRIPIEYSNKFCRLFASRSQPSYIRNAIALNKCEDLAFKQFLIKNYPNITVHNLTPNIVDHIDYLLSGSVVNSDRVQTQIRSRYWNENYLVEALKYKLLYK